MSYQVLARKWRPQTFEDMVGQEHVLKALIHALESQRLHHAYLFTGTRGVGKTTIGRLLARCLNCETGITPTPCGECSSCLEIQEGRFADLIEIDAASRTGVDDMRELTDNVQYTPTRGRFKVYLIDEVHMLTNQSFNAFLKTLEEPPEHVKFLLATTDPQKLPVTVLSRCLQFNLKRMTPEHIANHLNHVLTQEQVPFEEAALWLLARAADGSMRDALSLTDQAISYSNRQLAASDVSSMLGTLDQSDIARLVEALVTNDGPGMLAEVRRIADFAPDYSVILADLLSLFHRVTMEQVVPGSVDNALGDAEQIQSLARQLSAEDAQLFYQAALIGRKDLAITPDARMGFEMALLRMLAFRPGAARRQPPSLASSTAAASEPAEDPDRARPPSEEAAPVTAPTTAPVPLAPSGSEAAAVAAPRLDGDRPGGSGPDAPVQSEPVVPAYVEEQIAAPQDQPPWEDEAAEPVAAPQAEPVPAVAALPDQPGGTGDGFDWPREFRSLGIVGMPGNLASHGAMHREGDAWVLTLEDGHARLLNDRHQSRILDALKQRFGGATTLRIEVGDTQGLTPAVWEEQQRQARQASAEEAIRNDPLVNEIVERFDARVVEESIRPVVTKG
ncbi:DNA polymerase III subunit gamma/tau [Marinobacter sp. X15-166B]|uniref:DNA polymerase III subunit gamma/tau n=1 Tax=Marinobacter sp. X15-166B TaxID=1897620 RepID=UPI00085BC709|nr:DNA polymerase III subunit gamma/tau [Marinobacter sp. X15-166B]OEY67738.1 DNA polymerase III subunit gamma/tau [Marinobacter sp. X15-166B]